MEAPLDNNTSYRRGLAFGLTLAETFIIIAFVLLLLFARGLQHLHKLGGDSQSGDAKNRVEDPRSQIERIKQMIRINKSLIEEGKASTEPYPATADIIDDLFRELRRAKEQIKQAQDKLAESNQKTLKYEEELSRYKEEQKRLQNEVVYLTGRIGAVSGHGTVMPPCWTKDDGSIEYIFNIELTSEGIVVHKNDLPEHGEELLKLVPSLRFDSPLSRSEFLRATERLYQWERSQHPECRFFVRVQDETEPNQKALYKDELRTVENRFYKLLVGE